MVHSKAEFKKLILVRIEKGLASLSFSKKPVGLFKELGGEFSGYIGLPVSTHLPQDRIGVAPVVGITYVPLENLVRKLSDPSFFPNDATLITAVGYLTAQNKFMEWVFDPTVDPESEIAKIIRAVEEYGLPFMQEHTSLDSVINELEANRFTVNDLKRYRLPAAYFLAGRKDEARGSIEQGLRDLGTRSDSAANHFRDFARAFMVLQ